MALPRLIAKNVPSMAVGASAGVLGLVALCAFLSGWPVTGQLCAILAVTGFSVGETVASLRDETLYARIQRVAFLATPPFCAIMVGEGSPTGRLAAVWAIIVAVLAERAGTTRIRRRWWASPAAYPIVMLPALIWHAPIAALVTGGLYAAATLAAAIEALREKP